MYYSLHRDKATIRPLVIFAERNEVFVRAAPISIKGLILHRATAAISSLYRRCRCRRRILDAMNSAVVFYLRPIDHRRLDHGSRSGDKLGRRTNFPRNLGILCILIQHTLITY